MYDEPILNETETCPKCNKRSATDDWFILVYEDNSEFGVCASCAEQYEYCPHCQKVFAKIERAEDDPESVCMDCHTTLIGCTENEKD